MAGGPGSVPAYFQDDTEVAPPHKMRTTLKQIGIILIVSGFLALVANSLHPRRIPWVQNWSRQVEEKAARQKIKVIPLSVALEKFRSGESVFIDARPSNDYMKSHIAGAVSIPFGAMDEKFTMLAGLIDSGDELVTYCSSRECDDALLLAAELQSMGCSNLALYIDGYELWEKHGGEVEP